MKIGDKVFVTNWMKIYSTFRKWNNNINERVSVFPWKIKLPDYILQSNDTVVRTARLTLQGKPFKNGETVEISRVESHKDYEYTIIHHLVNVENRSEVVYLLSSNHVKTHWNKVYVQISREGITHMTPQEQKQVAHLQNTARLQALAKDNIGKWEITSNFKDNFPKELITVYYDSNQNVQFGAGMTKGIVTYEVIPKEYTVDNISIHVCTGVYYNGEGCDLTDKKIINWVELREMCSRK